MQVFQEIINEIIIF